MEYIIIDFFQNSSDHQLNLIQHISTEDHIRPLLINWDPPYFEPKLSPDLQLEEVAREMELYLLNHGVHHEMQVDSKQMGKKSKEELEQFFI